MQPDAADPGIPAPDHVPDELVERYGRRARDMVRYHHSRRFRVAQHVRDAAEPLRDRDVWSVAALVFFWTVAIAGLLGGLGYAIYLWPVVGLSILGGVLVIVAISVLLAVRFTRHPAGPASF